MDSNNDNNNENGVEVAAKSLAIGAGLAVGGGIVAACCAPALIVVGIGAILFAALGSGGESK